MAINGFSTCNPRLIGTYKVPGTNHTYLAVRREIAPLLIGFATEFNRLVEPLDGYGGRSKANDCWGYACRKVRGRNVVSFHSGGLAIDLNATKHPLGRTGTFRASQVATIRALCRKYGLRWGGDYRGRKDPMHLEVILPRSQALALVKRLQTPVAARPPANRPAPRPTTPRPGTLVVDGKLGPATWAALGRRVKSSSSVLGKTLIRDLQTYLRVTRDGKLGPVTIKALQRRVRTTADGKWGPNTTRALQKALNAGTF